MQSSFVQILKFLCVINNPSEDVFSYSFVMEAYYVYLLIYLWFNCTRL
jgi:hypothetical protein